MKRETVALIFQEGGRVLTELIKNRPVRPRHGPPAPELSTGQEQTGETGNRGSSVEAGCVPCSIGHFGTCSGLMAESLRFGRKDGIESDEVISRVNLCLDELNTMERVDLRPELIQGLPDWEKKLANDALAASRRARHSLEGMAGIDDLEKTAADIQSTRQEIGKSWFRERMKRMSPEEKKRLAEKTAEKLSEEEDDDQR